MSIYYEAIPSQCRILHRNQLGLWVRVILTFWLLNLLVQTSLQKYMFYVYSVFTTTRHRSAPCISYYHNVTYYFHLWWQISQAALGDSCPKFILVINLSWGAAGFMKPDKAEFGHYPVWGQYILHKSLWICLFAAKTFNLLC